MRPSAAVLLTRFSVKGPDSVVLRTAQLEAIGSTEEFALPQTGMFNPRKGENVPARSLPRTPL